MAAHPGLLVASRHFYRMTGRENNVDTLHIRNTAGGSRMSKSTQTTAAKPRKKPFFTNDDLWGYAFIGVAVIFFLMFTI